MFATVIHPTYFLFPSSSPSHLQFQFVPFSQLESITPNSLVDIVAICSESSPVSSITTKTTGKTINKRDIVLLDPSGLSINCTLWGNDAVSFEPPLPCVMVMKSARVSDFGGVSGYLYVYVRT